MIHKPKKKPKKSRTLTKREIDVYKEVEHIQKACLFCGSLNYSRHHIRGGKSRDTYIGNIALLCGSPIDKMSCHGKVHNNERYWKQELIDMVNHIHGLDLPYHYIFKESD
jgi:hypothetical protein